MLDRATGQGSIGRLGFARYGDRTVLDTVLVKGVVGLLYMYTHTHTVVSSWIKQSLLDMTD